MAGNVPEVELAAALLVELEVALFPFTNEALPRALIETIRQRPVKGDDGLGSDFATVLLQVGITSSSFPESP